METMQIYKFAGNGWEPVDGFLSLFPDDIFCMAYEDGTRYEDENGYDVFMIDYKDEEDETRVYVKPCIQVQ